MNPVKIDETVTSKKESLYLNYIFLCTYKKIRINNILKHLKIINKYTIKKLQL